MAQILNEPVTLPSGLVLPNRLFKAAMAENMADSTGLPGSRLFEAYDQWSEGGWGALLTGNVDVDVNHMGSARDMVVKSFNGDEDLTSWKKLATISQKNGTQTMAQINHPGRQSAPGAGNRGFWGKTIAPSAIPLDLGSGIIANAVRAFAFGTPREMTVSEIETVVQQFAGTAKVMESSGFAGVELHGAHGYLLAQFLSPSSNKRNDAYGGTPEKRAKIVVDIIKEIRKSVSAPFAVGIKLNSVDHQDSADMEATLSQIRLIVEAGVDFLEISGGTYEDPKMIGQSAPQQSSRTAAREAFFLDFAHEIRKHFPKLVLMVTGGFRTRAGMEAAISNGSCDLIGIARPAAINPKVPKLILDKDVPAEEVNLHLNKLQAPFLLRVLGVRLLTAGAETVYYAQQIQRMGKKLLPIAP
ncbi:hypothetical protein FQN54_009040 [Arachnomyces sp. PD_36]|nr:hypothetical protein FQN54_009040 [Arachnomyces sp. PD_36]